MNIHETNLRYKSRDRGCSYLKREVSYRIILRRFLFQRTADHSYLKRDRLLNGRILNKFYVWTFVLINILLHE